MLAIPIADKLLYEVYKLELFGIIKQCVTHIHRIFSEVVVFAEVEVCYFRYKVTWRALSSILRKDIPIFVMNQFCSRF